MQLGKLFLELAQNAGIDVNQDAFNAIGTIDTNVPDDIVTQLKSGLMSLGAAKNNLDLKKYFHAQALDAVDNELKGLIEGFEGFEDSDIEKFNSEKSSYKRMNLVWKRANEIAQAKIDEAGKGGGDAEAHKKSIETLKGQLKDLNKQLLDKETQSQQAIESAKKDAENSILNYAINSELSGREYVQDKLGKDVNVTVARTLLDKKLEEVGALVVRDEKGNVKLVQREAPEMDFMQDNQEVKFVSFVDKTLGESNMLKVTETDPEKGGGSETRFNRIENKEGENQLPAEATNFYEEQLKDFPTE